MTKKDIIKQEIMGTLNLYSGQVYDANYVGAKRDVYINVSVVDLDKLTTLLAKYLDIKIEEEKPHSGYISPKTGNSTYNKMPEKVEIINN